MNLINQELYQKDIITIANDKNIDFSKLKNKSILITGACGLICSFLIDVLMYRNSKYGDNITIYALGRNESKLLDRFNYYDIQKYSTDNTSNLIYIIQDVCESFNFDIRFDYIIHGASNTHPILYATDPVGTITTNVIGLNNILSYCTTRKPERVFIMSSVEIYGENKGDLEKFHEDSLGYINSNTLRAGYPEAKRLGEAMCQAYGSQYGINTVIGRFSRVYGPTLLKDDSKALSQFIRNAINNEDIVLKSNGEQFFSYIHVADAVSALLTILLNGKTGEAYNISDTGSDIKLKDLAKILSEINNRNVIFEMANTTESKGYSTATKAILDSTKLKELGWKTIHDIRSGLISTIKIIKELK